MPVYAGCAEPLIAEWVGAEYVHGQDGMGDSFFPQAKQRPEPEHAVDELVRRINESPGELTILAQAPLTNLAAAVARDPSIAGKVRAPVRDGRRRSGTSRRPPSTTSSSTRRRRRSSLNAGFPLTLFTWSLTRTHGVFDDDQARADRRARHAAVAVLRAGQPQGARVRRQGQPPRRLDAPRLDGRARRSSSPRSCSRPRRRSSTSRPRGELTRGWSLIDTLSRTGREPNARVVTDYDTEAFFELLLGVLS